VTISVISISFLLARDLLCPYFLVYVAIQKPDDNVAANLEIALDRMIKTKILCMAFLSFPQMKEYLAVLQEKGLLEHLAMDHEYRMTDKGKQFVKMYKDVGRIMFRSCTPTRPASVESNRMLQRFLDLLLLFVHYYCSHGQ
jgi:predicted transcriptional regulator